jgi:hypothetical protein
MNPQDDVHFTSRLGWLLLRIALIIETAGGAFILWNVLQAFIAANTEPLGSRLSLLLAVVISWAWISITLWGALKVRASWVRGSALTIHILMFAAATGVLQGLLRDGTALGWTLLMLALIGFLAAVISRPMPQKATEGEALD